MPITPEERARIARENGVKSKGPVTPEGKDKSARNSIKTGEYADKLSRFLPPDSAILCNEDRQTFFNLVDQLGETYQPVNPESANIVRQIAIARWQIERLHQCITMQWNFALLSRAAQPLTVTPELGEIEVMVRASTELFTGTAAVDRLNRQIDRLEIRTRLRRAFKDVQVNFPSVPISAPEAPQKRTQPEPVSAVENKEVPVETPENNVDSEPPIFLTERDEFVIQAYRREFPNRRIVLLPPDDVAKGIDIEDDMPVAPRRAA